MKKCSICKAEKPIADYLAISGSGRKYSRCIQCRQTTGRVYKSNRYATDPEFKKRIKELVLVNRETRSGRSNVMFNAIKSSAARRGLPVTIVKSDIVTLLEAQNWVCAKTGIPFDLTSGRGRRPFGPSVDRIDGSMGYEPGNIQIVCVIYNLAKSEFTCNDVTAFAKALVDHQKL
jgi:hypothetical protein